MSEPSSATFIRPPEFWRMLGIKANQTVVHFGCGAGFYLIPAAKMVGKKGKVIGIDVRSDMLEEAEGRAERENLADTIRTVRSNLEKNHGSTLPDNTADWTLVANILYQADPVKILTEAARVTKNDGMVIVVEWDTVATPLGPPAESRVDKKQLLHIAKEAGLRLEQEFDPSPYHYGLLFVIHKS